MRGSKLLLTLYATLLTLGVMNAQSHREMRPNAALDARQFNRVLYVESQATISSLSTFDTLTGAKESLLAVSHSSGYPIKATLAPKGEYVAYNRLPAGNKVAFNGELWIANLADKSTPRLVDRQTDSGWPPRWDPIGEHVFYVKKRPYLPDNFGRYSEELYVSDLLGNTKHFFSDATSLEIVPIGWSSDGSAVYVDRIFPDGDSLYQIEINTGKENLLARLSSSAADGVALSPGGETILADISSESSFPNKTYSLIAVSTQNGHTIQLVNGSPRSYCGIWEDGSSILLAINNSMSRYRLSSDPQDRTAFASSMQETAEVTAMAPISLSPDKMWLLVSGSATPGEPLYILDRTLGRLHDIPSIGWSQFVGWLGN